MSGAVLSPFIFDIVKSQTQDYYQEQYGYLHEDFITDLTCERKSDEYTLLFPLSDLWSLLLIIELAFFGNIVFLMLLLIAVKNVTSKLSFSFLRAWHYWMVVSFVLSGTFFAVMTVYQVRLKR